jgi:hypothetical protein
VAANAVPPLRLGRFAVPEVPLAVRDRTLAAADRVAAGEIELFGRRLALSSPPDWHAVIHRPGRWPDLPWWQIDLRSEDRPGDVKWVWELGRHRHLVLLARAVHLARVPDRYRVALEEQLRSWLEANPPERGVHWSSSLEIALRSLAWLQILTLAGERLEPETRHAMAHHLYQAGRHLVRDLPATVATSRHNHLLGDALGLVALGMVFEGPVADRWARWGDELFARQVRRMVRPDGSTTEDSVSYHRFVLEMLTARVLLGGASPVVGGALTDAAQFLARLGGLDGPVPQYGDWDEGRVFAVAEHRERISGSVRLALAVAGTGAASEWRDAHDEVAWHAPEGFPIEPEPAETEGGDVGAGIARAARGRFVVWLKAGSGPSHGHADLTSVAVAHEGRWLIGDPGTGAYNESLELRDELRRSAAHNVVRVEGRDQLEPHRVFRWCHRAQGRVGNSIVGDDSVLLWGCHDAYRRLDPPRRVVRAVIVTGAGVAVGDWVEGDSVSLEGSLPLPPDVAWDPVERTLAMGSDRFPLQLPNAPQEDTAWWSETYGHRTEAVWLTYAVPSARRLVWSIGESKLPDGILEHAAVEFRDGHVTLTIPGALPATAWC